MTAYAALIAGDLDESAVEGAYRRRDGTQVLVESFRRAVPSGEGHMIVSVARDITARKHGEVALRRFRAAMDASSDAIYLIDRATMRYIDVNETACRMTGAHARNPGPRALRRARSKRPRTWKRFSTRSSPAGRDRAAGIAAPAQGRRAGVGRTHAPRPAHGRGWVIISVVRDITERKKLEERLLQQANYDSLTALPNRTLLYDRLRQGPDPGQEEVGALEPPLRRPRHFKEVNDTHGTAPATSFLKQVAQAHHAVRSRRRHGRPAGRGRVRRGAPGNRRSEGRGAHRAQGDRFACQAFRPGRARGFDIGGASASRRTRMTAIRVDELIRNADSAMFSAKEAGRNACRFYSQKEGGV